MLNIMFEILCSILYIMHKHVSRTLVNRLHFTYLYICIHEDCPVSASWMASLVTVAVRHVWADNLPDMKYILDFLCLYKCSRQ